MFKTILAGMHIAEDVRSLSNEIRSFKVQRENAKWHLFCFELDNEELVPVEYWGAYRIKGDAEYTIRQWIIGK